MISFLGDILGQVMFWCYYVINNYGISIIIFTFFTKIILMPISVLVQKNSIKIVKMQPELNMINADNWGNKERISEEQINLYKKEKYSPLLGLVPLFAQIAILMGIIDVMYKPLKHLLKIDNVLIQKMVELYCELSGKNPKIGAIQVYVMEAVRQGQYTNEFQQIVSQEIITSIQNMKMNVFSLNLGVIPSDNLGIYILIPILAGMTAFLLCLVQNKINVLQSEQGNMNKFITMAISVGLSLYLGFFVPAGVGTYWMFSNLFAIIQLLFLNCIINPKKYIDYTALEESKKALDKVKKYSMPQKKWYEKDIHSEKEKADYKRFFKTPNKELVIYSEKNGFYKYFKGIIDEILLSSDIVIHYVTSDPMDQIFKTEEQRIQTYYIGDIKLITFMMKMDADIVLMTMPDLDKYQIKRSYVKKDTEYIYLHHAINSINLTLRNGALDFFDTIFAHSDYCVEELRQIEKLHNIKEKTIVKYGYSMLDELIESYNQNQHIDNDKPVILIAPSWQKNNILDSCIEPLLDGLVGNNYKIIIRPHPQYLRYSAGVLDYLEEKYKERDKNLLIERDFSSNSTIYTADILITDWSSISYEYSFSTLKPTLFIDTPMKVMNERYNEIEKIPFDIECRNLIGKSLKIEDINEAKTVIDNLLATKGEFAKQLEEIRNHTIYHIGKSAKVGADYIISRIQEIRKINESKEEWER